MGAWNLKEFKTYCIEKNLEQALKYTESLVFKWDAAKYHKENALQKFDELKTTRKRVLYLENEIAFELKKVDEPHESAGQALLDIERDKNLTVDLAQKRHCPKCEDIVMQQHFFSVKLSKFLIIIIVPCH